MESQSKFFYCYSAKLRRFLTENGIGWVDRGFNNTTGSRYWLFSRNDRFEKVITSYNNNK